MPTGAALAFIALLWGMSWPWLRTLAVVSFPVGAALNMVVWLWHSCFLMGAVMALGACIWAGYGLGNMSIGAALTLAACPLECYFP